VIDVYRANGRLFTFGNGSSACDANHLAEELLARYKRERQPLAATCLSADASVLTCIVNDYSFEEILERQVRGVVRSGDLVVGFTTSGRSENVVRALATARVQEMHVLLLHLLLEPVDLWAAGPRT
jgi:D-sedoheptulose 7-phosphate isomerase